MCVAFDVVKPHFVSIAGRAHFLAGIQVFDVARFGDEVGHFGAFATRRRADAVGYVFQIRADLHVRQLLAFAVINFAGAFWVEGFAAALAGFAGGFALGQHLKPFELVIF